MVVQESELFDVARVGRAHTVSHPVSLLSVDVVGQSLAMAQADNIRVGVNVFREFTVCTVLFRVVELLIVALVASWDDMAKELGVARF